MDFKKITILLAFFLAFLSAAPSKSAGSEIMKKFTEALDSQNLKLMSSVVADNKDKIPAEIKALLDGAVLPSTPAEERDSRFFLAERVAAVYRDVTGDAGPLKTVKKTNFESRLSQPVRLTPINGVYAVETLYTDEAKNFFRPDNIIIKAGETVRWSNHDKAAHIFASMPFIGEGGIFSTKVEPGGSWEYRFDKPGEYYYICFIHKVMYGKITVE